MEQEQEQERRRAVEETGRIKFEPRLAREIAEKKLAKRVSEEKRLASIQDQLEKGKQKVVEAGRQVRYSRGGYTHENKSAEKKYMNSLCIMQT